MIDTLQNRESIPDADFTIWVTPESLAEVILFLSSGAARDVHSAALPVFGRGVEGDFQALNILLSDKMKAFSLKSAIISVIEKKLEEITIILNHISRKFLDFKSLFGVFLINLRTYQLDEDYQRSL
jgi:hypothetical protein